MRPIFFCVLKGCPRCGGDLVFDEGDWRCWQCAAYYYAPNSTVGPGPPSAPGECIAASRASKQLARRDAEPATKPEGAPRRRRREYGARSARNINAVVHAKQLSDRRWWTRNRQIIEYLEKGLSIREVAREVGLGERQVRVIREKLGELKASEP